MNDELEQLYINAIAAAVAMIDRDQSYDEFNLNKQKSKDSLEAIKVFKQNLMYRQHACNLALDLASQKNLHGLLINTNDLDFESQMNRQCTELGDKETVYTIIALYADDKSNDGSWEDHIHNELFKIFPEHF